MSFLKQSLAIALSGFQQKPAFYKVFCSIQSQYFFNYRFLLILLANYLFKILASILLYLKQNYFIQYPILQENRMLLESYQEKGLLTVTLVKGQTSKAGVYAYRGDLVLKEGALRDGSSTDRKPPEALLIHSALIIEGDKIKFINGLLPTLDLLPVLVEKYKADIAADCVAVIYVENISKALQVVLEGVTYKLLPFKEGLVWNEILEELYIEKSELKGQSAEDKVAIAYAAAKDYKAKGSVVSLDEACSYTFVVVKEDSVGAI
jgi:hypothetical protein